MLLMIHECNYISQSILPNMPNEWERRLMRTQQALISLIHAQESFYFAEGRCYCFKLIQVQTCANKLLQMHFGSLI